MNKASHDSANKKPAINAEKTKGCNAVNNYICAYRECEAQSSVRLYFPLGFSALFCHKCANILLSDTLATPEASDHEKQNYFDGLDGID
jgi:hypothetical protein